MRELVKGRKLDDDTEWLEAVRVFFLLMARLEADREIRNAVTSFSVVKAHAQEAFEFWCAQSTCPTSNPLSSSGILALRQYKPAALVVLAIGYDALDACTACHKRSSKFLATCKAIPGIFKGCCVSCMWVGYLNDCSLNEKPETQQRKKKDDVVTPSKLDLDELGDIDEISKRISAKWGRINSALESLVGDVELAWGEERFSYKVRNRINAVSSALKGALEVFDAYEVAAAPRAAAAVAPAPPTPSPAVVVAGASKKRKKVPEPANSDSEDSEESLSRRKRAKAPNKSVKKMQERVDDSDDDSAESLALQMRVKTPKKTDKKATAAADSSRPARSSPPALAAATELLSALERLLKGQKK